MIRYSTQPAKSSSSLDDGMLEHTNSPTSPIITDKDQKDLLDLGKGPDQDLDPEDNDTGTD